MLILLKLYIISFKNDVKMISLMINKDKSFVLFFFTDFLLDYTERRNYIRIWKSNRSLMNMCFYLFFYSKPTYDTYKPDIM